MAVDEFHQAKIAQGIRRKIDSYHYEDSQGNIVEFCESCKRFRPAEVVHSAEDCDRCDECAIAITVNPAVLKWARESSGSTVEEAANRLKVPPATFSKWEAAEAPLKLSQLRVLTEYFKRPLAAFLLPAPPEESGPPKEESMNRILDSVVLALIVVATIQGIWICFLRRRVRKLQRRFGGKR